MTLFGLLDCNNFYVSCERVFNPRLEGKPVVVLSNNDGCIISRSNEAKQLNIPMGAPFFKWQAFCAEHQVYVYSSNYELYADMSSRVMTLLNTLCPAVEIYSIDEAFLILDGFKFHDLEKYMISMRNCIKTYIGLPVSIGFAQTKTLAKVANFVAKKYKKNGVCNLVDKKDQTHVLDNMDVQDIWGVGRNLAIKLRRLNIVTAKALRDSDAKKLRSYFSVTLEKTISELNGISCLPVEMIQPRQQIISSRSFRKLVTSLEELEEAISYYAGIAAAKLRSQKSVASVVVVFLHTNIFREKEPQYDKSVTFRFPNPTADTRYIVHAAKACLKRIYRKNYRYHKTGIMLLDLLPDKICQQDFLVADALQEKSIRTMKAVDHINEIMGRNTVFYCAEGIERHWQIKADYCSPRYTTRWEELVRVS